MAKKLLRLLPVALLILPAALLCALTHPYPSLPERVSSGETMVLGQNRLMPGSQTAIRNVVRNVRSQKPLQRASVKVSLRPAPGRSEVPMDEVAPGVSETIGFRFKVQAGLDASQAAAERQSSLFNTLGRPALALATLVSFFVMGLSVHTLRQHKILRRSLLISASALVVFVLAVVAWGFFFFPFLGEGFFAVGSLLGPLALLGLAIYSVARRDSSLVWMQVLHVLYFALAAIRVIAWYNSKCDLIYLDRAWIAAATIAYLLMPLAFLLRAAGLGVSRQYLGAAMAFPAAFFLLAAWGLASWLVMGTLGNPCGDPPPTEWPAYTPELGGPTATPTPNIHLPPAWTPSPTPALPPAATEEALLPIATTLALAT